MSGNAGSTAGGGSGGGSGGALGGAGSGGAAAGGTAGSAGSAGTAGASGSGGSGSGAFELRSPAFEYSAECSDEARETCEVFPDENIQYMGGGNTSPELSWTGVPAGTMSFALVLQDLSNGFAHWVLWNIPGSATGLPAGIDKTSDMPSNVEGAQQAGLGSGAEDHGYFGPGSSCNVYQFALYALSMATFSPTQATNQTQVRMQLEALGDAILGTTELTGRSNYMMMCSD
jgi:Raf kinase inhibitor-like YbhB/YbcL family protein